MASTTIVTGISATMKLLNGNNSDGTSHYETQSVGSIDPDSYNETKLRNIVEKLEDILLYNVGHIVVTQKSTLTL